MTTNPRVKEEWAVRYRDPNGVMGVDQYQYITVSDQKAAETVATWHHAPWDEREKVVVRRYTTNWEEVE